MIDSWIRLEDESCVYMISLLENFSILLIGE